MAGVLIIFGTRPEAIKMAPVISQLKKSSRLDVRVCNTGQHGSMLDQVLEDFEIRPDFDLKLMQPSQSLSRLSARLFEGLEKVLTEFKPSLSLVHGDTSTTMIGAIASFYEGVAVGHVEAGLRTKNKRAPFPEEVNRRVTGVAGDFHFAPTERARQNLLSESVSDDRIFVTGNTVIDALHMMLAKIKSSDETLSAIRQELSSVVPFDFESQKFVMITGHRRESFGEGFLNLCRGLKQLSQAHPDVQFLYPAHLNPNVQKPVKEILSGLNNLHIVEPLNYKAFLYLMDRCHFILSDSGGIQEEAPALGKPVLVMRETTERPEAIEAGTAKLVGTSTQTIFESATELLSNKDLYQAMADAKNPFGDGTASEKILKIIETEFLHAS